MANTYFKFKQFTIHQENAAMKVGTDGVLLGAWADCLYANNILDIGTGTGLVALMLAQRTKAQIDAIEIDNLAILDADLNVKNSPWKNQISIYHKSIQDFNPHKKYELIVSNPPYFSHSLKAKTEARTKARHDEGLSTHDLFSSVKRLLTDEGKFCVVIPTDNHDYYIETARQFSFFCSKKLWLKPTPTKASKRILMEFITMPTDCIENEMILEDKGRHQYSDEYISLTKDFYLNF